MEISQKEIQQLRVSMEEPTESLNSYCFEAHKDFYVCVFGMSENVDFNFRLCFNEQQLKKFIKDMQDSLDKFEAKKDDKLTQDLN